MPKVKDIYDFIDSFAPYDTACKWDNTGISVGDETQEVKKIVFALDITGDVADFAKEINADLIITHHPLIFNPVKQLPASSTLYKIANCGIAHISAHTNFDLAEEGVNTLLCDKLNLKITDSIKSDDVCLYICKTENEIDIVDFVHLVKEKLGGTVRYNGKNTKINTVAVCSGAGADYLSEAKENGADVLLTGDGSHHDFLDANEMGIALICAGHFETENPAIDWILQKIENEFAVECVRAPQETAITTI